ncbi:MAG: hypothetical protein KKG92_01900 [Gammaproteobacteria bacterium]|nr:hypothetical protein [Gammaproteobacteria bacterium]
MNKPILSLFAAAILAAVLNTSPVLAGAGHDHGPKYGGVVREVKNVAYELVAKPDSLTLYVSDHGKPVSTQGTQAEAVIYAGNEKTSVTLAPAGDNRLVAKGNIRVGVGVRVAVTVIRANKSTTKATFKLK